MAYSRVHRLLKVLTLVKGGVARTPADLASACGVSERTVFRDMTELEGAGFPVSFDRKAGTYRFADAVFLPPVELEADEALALAVLAEQVAAKGQIGGIDAACRAIAKIKASLPASVRAEVDALLDRLVIRTAPGERPGDAEDVYERVRQAIASRTALVCRYASASSSSSAEPFDFEPYALFFSVRAWYAVGFHAGRDAVRTLKLSRFEMVKPTSRGFEIPSGFTLEAHLGNAWRMIRGDEEHDVELRFDATVADNIAETLWHRTQEIEHGPDGSVVFRCRVAGLDEIVWWVLSMGPACEVIAPPELRSRVRGLAAETAERNAAVPACSRRAVQGADHA